MPPSPFSLSAFPRARCCYLMLGLGAAPAAQAQLTWTFGHTGPSRHGARCAWGAQRRRELLPHGRIQHESVGFRCGCDCGLSTRTDHGGYGERAVGATKAVPLHDLAARAARLGEQPCMRGVLGQGASSLVGRTICRSCCDSMPEPAGPNRPNNRPSRHTNRHNFGADP